MTEYILFDGTLRHPVIELPVTECEELGGSGFSFLVEWHQSD